MHNYKLIIQYDGTDYSGWQSQPNGNTIQDVLTTIIQKITQTEVNITGSGRTDAGVHAFGQTANFKIDEHLDIYRFQHAINSVLPSSIAIKKTEKVKENFHSRFDAKKRSYLYFISKHKTPFYNKYSWHYPDSKRLNIKRLNNISLTFLGEHNFTSFCKKKTDTENKICTIHNARWKETENFYIFHIEANRFLHGMVRTIVGTVLQATKQNKTQLYIKKILEEQNREAAGQAVPAKGLFLFKVKY